MNCSSGLTSPDGGSFSTPTATITFFSTRCRAEGTTVLPPGPGDKNPVGSGDMLPLSNCSHLSAKFTTDGSSPATGGSDVLRYTEPITIGETTTIRALISVDGVDRTLVHNMTFTKETRNHSFQVD